MDGLANHKSTGDQPGPHFLSCVPKRGRYRLFWFFGARIEDQGYDVEQHARGHAMVLGQSPEMLAELINMRQIWDEREQRMQFVIDRIRTVEP